MNIEEQIVEKQRSFECEIQIENVVKAAKLKNKLMTLVLSWKNNEIPQNCKSLNLKNPVHVDE